MTPTSTKPTGERKRTLDQLRARDAWDRVEKLQYDFKNKKEAQEDYVGEAHKLPVRIMASGLGQALAYLRAKAKKRDVLDRLYADLSEWVLDRRLDPLPTTSQVTAGVKSEDRRRSLLHRIIDGDSDFLRRATEETLAYLTWLNRFAEAELTASDTPPIKD